MFLLNLVILAFCFGSKVYSKTLFFDDFSNNSLDKWEINNGNIGGTVSWFVDNGELHGRANKNQFSYLYIKDGIVDEDYIVESVVRNISGVDQQYVLRVSNDKKEYYLVDYRFDDSGWYWDNNNIKVYKIYSDHFVSLGTYPSNEIPRSFDIARNVYHNIKIEVVKNTIKVYFDEKLAIDVTDTDGDYLSGAGFGLMTWGGDLPYVSENIFDNVKVSDRSVIEGSKIIILPGLGASWNAEAILTGNTGPSYQWTMTPFVKNYNLLINALEINDKERNDDFYVWNYDWRKPLKKIVDDFDKYIDTLSLENNQKVYLVGHSLGGLVARIWTQDNAEKVEKVITLGSPHYGSLKAYEVWNSARVGDSLGVDSIALNVLLQLQKKNNSGLVETLRSYAPIVYDLSPTFMFLTKNGIGVTTRVSEYLLTKNDSVVNNVDKLITVDGVGVSTKEWINLENRTFVDQMLGIWEEGRPMSYVYGNGDGTVLKKSALIDNSETEEFESEHGALVDSSVNFILEKLGLGITVSANNVYPRKQVVFYLASSAKMTVKCGSSEKSDIEGWVIMENQELKNCSVRLMGIEDGTYHLAVGENDNWDYQEGQIKNGQLIMVNLDKRKNCWTGLRRGFKRVGALEAYNFSEKENVYKTIDAYSNFFEKNKSDESNGEIRRNLKCILYGGR